MPGAHALPRHREFPARERAGRHRGTVSSPAMPGHRRACPELRATPRRDSSVGSPTRHRPQWKRARKALCRAQDVDSLLPWRKRPGSIDCRSPMSRRDLLANHVIREERMELFPSRSRRPGRPATCPQDLSPGNRRRCNAGPESNTRKPRNRGASPSSKATSGVTGRRHLRSALLPRDGTGRRSGRRAPPPAGGPCARLPA